MAHTGILSIGLGCLIFLIGLVQSLTSKKFLGYLFGVELIINAANINLVGFLQIQPWRTDIQPLMAMIVALAVIETVVGLAIFTWVAKETGTDIEFSIV